MNRKIWYFAKRLKIIFQKMKYSKIDQWRLGYDYFWPPSKAHKLDMYYSNETFHAF